MKWHRIILCFLFTPLLSACNNTPSGIRSNKSASSVNTQETFEDLYKRLNVIHLPFSSTSSDFWKSPEFVPLSPGIYNSIYDTTEVRTNIHIAKLPPIYNFDMIILYYQDRLGSDVVELYTFKETTRQTDHLKIYQTEKLRNDSIVIRQEFIINNDYRIRTSKYIRELLIEQIYYTITAEGNFEEVRDGKTPIITYETYLHSDSLLIESFIWKATPSGELKKTELVQKVYDMSNYY